MNLFKIEVGDQVNFEFGGFGVPVVADFAGDAEDARASESGVGEKHIAPPLGDEFVLDSGFEDDVAEGDTGFDLEVLEGKVNRGESSENGDDGVSEGFCP